MRRAAAAAIAIGLASGPASAETSLAARLDAALAARALRGASISALVVSANDHHELYSKNADRALAPASNQKVLTALASLSVFGPAHRFRTELRVDRTLDAAGSTGTLYVVGGGDPGLTTEEWARLAADLRARGLRRLRDIVLDDGLFDRVSWFPGWGAVSSRAYHAPISALNANYGAFTTWVEAGARPGDPVKIRVDPQTPYFEVVNRARTGGTRSRTRLQVERQPGSAGERVVVTGTLPAGAAAQAVARSVADPTRYAGAVLRAQLQAAGIDVTGEVRVAPAPVGAAALYDFEGPTLGEQLVPFLKFSNNAIGETLCKDLAVARGAARASFEGCADALRDELQRLGVADGALVVADGSGLSSRNQVTPRTLVRALALARARLTLGPELVAALPIGGVDGTLRRRCDGARGLVRAKTGLISRVVALSGYAAAPDGGERIFSVLVNGYRGDTRGAMRALDAFAEALTEER